MDELPRRFGEAEGPAEYVMKPIRLEETRMSGRDDRLIDPNGSLPSKTPTLSPTRPTIYRRSKNPRPSKIAGIAFSIRAVRVPDCFAPAK